MDTISYTKHDKDGVGALRNDSAWIGSGPSVHDTFIQSSGSFEEEDLAYSNAATSTPGQDDETGSILADLWEESIDFGVHNGAAASLSLFCQTTARKSGESHADECISPRTSALSRSPSSSIPSEIDALSDAREVASGQRKASLQLLLPYDKGEAGGAVVGIVQNGSLAKDFDMRLKDAHTTVCVEEYHWHRDRPSRLLSYNGNLASSEENVDVDENAPSSPLVRNSDSEGEEGWMMAEDNVIPTGFEGREGSQGLMIRETGLPRSCSNKSRKFIRKKRKKTTSDKIAWPAIETVDRSKVAAPRALRHYSYGATLHLPPIGIQSHRDRMGSEVSVNEAVHEAELAMSQTYSRSEAQSGRQDEPRTMFRKRLIGTLLGITNIVLLGSTLACVLWAPVWIESRFALAAIPFAAWLCLILQILQLRRGRREAYSDVRSEEDVNERITAEAEEWRPEIPAPSWLSASI